MSAGARALGLLLGAVVLAGCPTFHQGPMPGEPKDASYRAVSGARVRYLDRGQGPAVVLLHGFASSLETWTDVIPALVPRHRVIALDLKGFGWTDRPEGDYGPRAQAELVLALLDQLGVRSAAVVAHSWGASVALAMALSNPERVERLALYDAWVFEEQLPTTFLWARADAVGELLFGLFYSERAEDKLALAFYDERHIDEGLVDQVLLALERPGTTAAALAAVRGQRFDDLAGRYGAVAQPVLLLWGREDRVATLPFGERLAAALPQARLVVYPRCGHFPMIEARAASTAELARFLAPAAVPSAATAAPTAPVPSAAPASAGPSAAPAAVPPAVSAPAAPPAVPTEDREAPRAAPRETP